MRRSGLVTTRVSTRSDTSHGLTRSWTRAVCPSESVSNVDVLGVNSEEHQAVLLSGEVLLVGRDARIPM